MPEAASVTSPVAHGFSMQGLLMEAVTLAVTALSGLATMLTGTTAGNALLAMLPDAGDDEVSTGSPNVVWGQLAAARVGDLTIHGDTVAVGSASVFVNGRPAARVGDATLKGGVIIRGNATVIIGGGTTALGSSTFVNPACAGLAQAMAMAMLSAHTYDVNAALPPGYNFLDPNNPQDKQTLAGLGVKPSDLKSPNSSFSAQVFSKAGTDPPQYVVAYRGTQDSNDVKNDLQQGVGADSDEYKRAISLSNLVHKGSGGTDSYTGHSLGGGLASAASVNTGQPGTTFNAAGLSEQTVGGYPATPAPVDAYYTRGEPLSAAQDNRAAVLGGLTGAAARVSPSAGGALGGFILGREATGQPLLPQAYGTRHELPRIPPPGASFWVRNNPVKWHSLDYTQRGIAAQQAALGCP